MVCFCNTVTFQEGKIYYALKFSFLYFFQVGLFTYRCSAFLLTRPHVSKIFMNNTKHSI
jgi:hypothetical protein